MTVLSEQYKENDPAEAGPRSEEYVLCEEEKECIRIVYEGWARTREYRREQRRLHPEESANYPDPLPILSTYVPELRKIHPPEKWRAVELYLQSLDC